MGRRRVAAKREILPDPKFGNKKIARFVNVLMKNGKKSVAQRLFYGALELAVGSKDKIVAELQLSEGTITKHVDYFIKVIDNVRPTVEVKSRRLGGATYQVPIEVPMARGEAIAMRWLVDAAQARGEKGMMLRLAAEMRDASENRGGACKKNDEMKKMCHANKAFASYDDKKKS